MEKNISLNAIFRKYHQQIEQGYLKRLLYKKKYPIGDCFIDLTFEAAKSNIEFKLDDIFALPEHATQRKRIIIKGETGSGKSTFCQYIANQWFTREDKFKQWRDKFDLVFWLPLRHLFSNKATDFTQTTLAEIICQRIFSGQKYSADTYIEIKTQLNELIAQDKVLLLLDGYDEIEPILDNNSIFEKFFKNELICNSHWILTSHPSFAVNIVSDLELEIIGFNNTNILLYVKKFFDHLAQETGSNYDEKANRLIKQFEHDHNLFAIANIPMQLELVCTIWDELENELKQSFQTTTELYSILILNLFRRYLFKYEKSLAPITWEYIDKETKYNCDKMLKFLEALAWESIKANKQILSPSLIKHVAENIWLVEIWESLGEATLHRLGLLKACGAVKNSVFDQEYYFIHSSFQQYLAAKYVFNKFKLNQEHEICTDHDLLKKTFMLEALAFMIQPEELIKQKLFRIILASKNQSLSHESAITPSVAITLLNYAWVSFKNMDLSGINISGADLNGADFEGANLSYANLTDVSVLQAYLGNTNLQFSKLKNIDLGIIHNPNSPLLIVHSKARLRTQNNKTTKKITYSKSFKIFEAQHDLDINIDVSFFSKNNLNSNQNFHMSPIKFEENIVMTYCKNCSIDEATDLTDETYTLLHRLGAVGTPKFKPEILVPKSYDKTEQIYGKNLTNTNFQSLFTSEKNILNTSWLDFNAWYHPDICRYLLQLVDNNAQCLAIVFPDTGSSNIDTFKKHLSHLIVLANKLDKLALFIAKEPGAEDHFICGVINGNRLLFINPLGLTKQAACYQTLAQLQQANILADIWFSDTMLQNSLYETQGLVSCGPITLELSIHILHEFTTQFLVQFWQQLDFKNPIVQYGLSFKTISINTLLPKTLAILSTISNSVDYKQNLCTIRKRHYKLLENLSIEQAKTVNKTVKEYLENFVDNAPVQVIFNNLITNEKNILNIDTLPEYQLLIQNLNKTKVIFNNLIDRTQTIHKVLSQKPQNNAWLIQHLFEIKDHAGELITPARDLLHKAAHKYFKLFLQEALKPYVTQNLIKMPVVFISYAWAIEGSDTYQQDKIYEGYVIKFAKALESVGCKVLLDRWYDKAGKALTEFLELMGQADILIPIGTFLYLYKYEKRAQLENQTEHVVRAEGQILNYIATYSSAWREKIKPVLFEGTPEKCLPMLFRQNIPIFFHTTDYFEGMFKLLMAIFNIDVRDNHFIDYKEKFFSTLKTLKQSEIIQNKENAYYSQRQIKQAKKQQENNDIINKLVTTIISRQAIPDTSNLDLTQIYKDKISNTFFSGQSSSANEQPITSCKKNTILIDSQNKFLKTYQESDYFKIIIVGDISKLDAAFVKSAMGYKNSSHSKSTLGVNFSFIRKNNIRFQLWDIAGQERLANLKSIYYKKTKSCFIFAKNFKALEAWHKDVLTVLGINNFDEKIRFYFIKTSDTNIDQQLHNYLIENHIETFEFDKKMSQKTIQDFIWNVFQNYCNDNNIELALNVETDSLDDDQVNKSRTGCTIS